MVAAVATTKILVEVLEEGLIIGERVQRVEDAPWAFDKVDAGLVILEFNVLPIDTLSLVLFLLYFKDRAVELPLEGFVRKIDEQLLKGINVELFEAVDVQHTDKAPLLAALGARRQGASSTAARSHVGFNCTIQ